MIRKKRYLAAKMGLLALGLMLLFPGQAEAADKKTIYNSPYVSFSPDGKAFTTCAGDQNYTWYAEDDSTTVYTGIKSSLRSLRTGEHYYKVARWGEVPVGSWKVVHRPGQCIHDGYTSDEVTDLLHKYLHEMNEATFGHRDSMTVGECWGATPEIGRLYTDPARKELSMIFQFEQIQLDKKPGGQRWDLKPLYLPDLKYVFSKWQTELEGHGWNSLFWNNHDLPRIVSRWGNDGDYRVLSAKMLATLLHGMKGTPYIYQGEEIGMTNVPFQTIDEFPDIETQNIYQERLKAGFTEEETMYAIRAKARDNARTPMQWNAEKNAGFTEGIPWYRVNPNYKEINVEQALADPESVFYHYQKLIQLRKEHEVMVYGTYQLLFPEDEDLYIYTRTLEEEKWLIVCNFHEKTRKLQCKRAGQVMLSNYADTPAAEKITELRPYEAVIYQMESWDANHGERGQDHSSDFEADIELV